MVFDVETTGLSAKFDEIVELAGVKVENFKITDSFQSFVKPDLKIPYHITEWTNITNEMVEDAPRVEKVLSKFLEFCGDSVLVAHNASLNIGFIRKKWRN